ncbi:xanthine dehydrogenase family protein molybdopterin-binding subunit [Rugamonas sp.]|uniref:xanthine dehydrogenase family protein molybdopterin-binding subunit n=1 Tax=Rugamonas sp. TaxID=1926287 RepID=UPI0025F79BA0|nr:xanthine dehydrogenase family protein molybdopterin-binding subunit [Rugamonas sp.]
MSNRRDFLKSTAALGAGMVLGLYVPMSRAEAKLASAEYASNVWLRIAEDNTMTVICARSEMGQGVLTALPMLVAEELNVDVHSLKVEIAPAAPAYINALLGAQCTGGSSSVRDAWGTLRTGGAQARTMLIAAAAQRWQVDAAQCRADGGKVFGPAGKSATYGQLAQAASKLPVPATVALKEAKDYTQIGKPTKRLDTPAKVNGSARFGIDVVLPGMVYASLEQCPVIGGKVRSFDGAAAKAMPGVIAVVQVRDGVAVVATSYWRAFKARQSLKIDWDEGAGAALNDKAMLDTIAGTAANMTANDVRINIASAGDAAAALKGAARTLTAEYHSPLLAHATMEPQNFTADVANGKCRMIGPTQYQAGVVGDVAAALGFKPEDVTVETTFLGGGFGRRVESDVAVQAAQISQAVGKPVKLVWTREDDTRHDFYRPQAVHRLAAGLDAAGKPVGATFELTSQSPTQRLFGLPKDKMDPFMVEGAVVSYDIAHSWQDVISHDAGLRVGYWRSVSNALNAFANESFFDELAHAAGQDPYAYRRELLHHQPRLAKVLELAAQKAGWDQPPAKGRARGIAVLEAYGSYLAQVVEISRKDDEIKVHRVVVAVDVGQMINPDTVEAQVQSSIAYGLSAALGSEITLEKGRIQQANFDSYPVLRMAQMPTVDVILVKNTEAPGGIGEPVTALVGPALANALFALTGKRVRKMPFSADNVAQAA